MYHKHALAGVLLIVGGLVGSIVALFVHSHVSHVFWVYDLTNRDGFGNNSDIYIRPWFRIPPYLVGMLGGVVWVRNRGRLVAFFQSRRTGNGLDA